MSVAVSDIREHVHCIYQCGPDGSLQNCEAMGLNPNEWCGPCGFLRTLPPDDEVLYDADDVEEKIEAFL